jgi:hypothetical protein
MIACWRTVPRPSGCSARSSESGLPGPVTRRFSSRLSRRPLPLFSPHFVLPSRCVSPPVVFPPPVARGVAAPAPVLVPAGLHHRPVESAARAATWSMAHLLRSSTESMAHPPLKNVVSGPSTTLGNVVSGPLTTFAGGPHPPRCTGCTGYIRYGTRGARDRLPGRPGPGSGISPAIHAT